VGPEHERLADEQPKRFNQLVYRALAEDLVGEAKAAELLDIKVTELRARRRMEVGRGSEVIC
jgi:hypothetical protein